MSKGIQYFEQELQKIREAGTWKSERVLTSDQKARINTTKADGLLNMCANNYLGLSNRPELIAAAKASYDKFGFGLFNCNTFSKSDTMPF